MQNDDAKYAGKEKRSHDRSPDQAQISMSIDKATLRMIDEAAEKTGRTRSNFVRWIIRRALAQQPSPV